MIGPRVRRPLNGYIERVNGKFRDEVLKRETLYTLKKAQAFIEK